MIQQKTIGSFTEIYTGGVITESYPTNFHTFVTRKVLTPDDSVDNYMEVTEAQRKTLEANDAKYTRPPQGFIDQFNSHCTGDSFAFGGVKYGEWVESRGMFLLNETYLTYEEALVVEDWYMGKLTYENHTYPTFFGCPCKTVFPKQENNIAEWLYRNCNNMKIQRILPRGENDNINSNVENCFWGTPIEKVLGTYCYIGNKKLVFSWGNKCREFWLSRIHVDCDFSKFQVLKLECWERFVTGREGDESLIYTVHPDVYAKLTGDTTNAAAAALTPDELAQWMALVETAAEKNITFATA